MRNLHVILPFTLLLFSLACLQDNPLTSRDTSVIKLSINLPSDTGKSLAKAAAIISVTVTVTADDMDDIEESLDISGQTASGTLKVPRGEDRTFAVECRDGNGIIQYSGSATQDILKKSETVTIITEGHYPSASTLTITGITFSAVTLAWTQNTDSDFQAYDIYRSLSAGVDINSDFITTISGQSTVSYVDDTVSPNTTYYYRVRVTDTEDLDSWSNEVSGQTPAMVEMMQVLSALGPWLIPDNGSRSIWFNDNNFAPSDAVVANVEYRLRIDDTGSDLNFWCGDYEIYISSSPSPDALEDTLVYDNLGSWTDGGFDDDAEDDSDIYLNWRSTSYFNGEDPNQYWGIYIVDNMSGDSGQLDYLEYRIHYLAPSSSPGMITITVPASAADEGPSLNRSHPTGGAQGSIEPVSTGLEKIKSPARR